MRVKLWNGCPHSKLVFRPMFSSVKLEKLVTYAKIIFDAYLLLKAYSKNRPPYHDHKRLTTCHVAIFPLSLSLSHSLSLSLSLPALKATLSFLFNRK